MINAQASSELFIASDARNYRFSMRSGRFRQRSVSTGSLISSDHKDGPDAFLVETGLVAVFLASGGTPPTCVALAGPGVLLETAADSASSYRAVGPVTLLAVPIATIEHEIARRPALRGLYLGQLRERLVRAEILATCNLRHSLPQRCSRWLITFHQHFGQNVPITHAFLASLLGVRRAGVSVTLERFQQLGMVRLQRGRISVINSSLLAKYACDCCGGHMLSEHPISARSLEGELEVQVLPAKSPARRTDVVTLVAQSNAAIEASRRLMRETWRLRSSALQVIGTTG
jgi:CRP-like cAMP-binding protein